MIFKRTASGLASIHLFFRVDKVIYCEGGTSLSVEQALKGEGEEDTLDVFFWKGVFAIHGGVARAHFKSIGSKESLRAIANDVIERQITTVSVCMDRDFDGFFDRLIAHEKIAYTWGYSWENDALCVDVVDRLIHRFCPTDEVTEELTGSVRTQIAEFETRVHRWCEVDVELIRRGRDGFVPRQAPNFLLDLQAQPPMLCATRLTRRLNDLGFKRCLRRRQEIATADIQRAIYGKLWATFVYHLFVYSVQTRVPQFKLARDLFFRLAITETFELIRAWLPHRIRQNIVNCRSAFV